MVHLSWDIISNICVTIFITRNVSISTYFFFLLFTFFLIIKKFIIANKINVEE